MDNRSKLTLFIILSIISCEIDCAKGKKTIHVRGDSNGPVNTIYYAVKNDYGTWEVQSFGPTSPTRFAPGTQRELLGTNISQQNIKLRLDELNERSKNKPKELSPKQIAQHKAKKAAIAAANKLKQDTDFEKMAAAILKK